MSVLGVGAGYECCHTWSSRSIVWAKAYRQSPGSRIQRDAWPPGLKQTGWGSCRKWRLGRGVRNPRMGSAGMDRDLASWVCVAELLTWNSRQLVSPGRKRQQEGVGSVSFGTGGHPSSGRMYAIDKHMLSTYCVQLSADQMVLERPLGRGVQSEMESSRGCGLWLLVVGLGSEMALNLEKGWYQMVNEMSPL